MAQIKPQWEEIAEFISMARHLVNKYPDRFAGIDPDWIVAYGCTNKDKPEGKTKPYDMSGASEPESFTNSKKYFIKMFMSDWVSRSEENKLWVVFSALERVDKELPDSGKIGPFDYKDQGTLVRTLGADWHSRNRLPNLLTESVEIVEESKYGIE